MRRNINAAKTHCDAIRHQKKMRDAMTRTGGDRDERECRWGIPSLAAWYSTE